MKGVKKEFWWLSDLGFKVVVCGGRRGQATERAWGARIFEKSSGICLKINDLEGKITETSHPSYSSRGEKNNTLRLLIPLFPLPLFSGASSREWESVSCLEENIFYGASHFHVLSLLCKRKKEAFLLPVPREDPPSFHIPESSAACTWCVDSWQWHLHLCVICLSSAEPFLVNTESICSGSLIECLPQTNGSPGTGENLDMQIWIEAPEKAILKIHIFPVRSSLCNEGSAMSLLSEMNIH